MRKARNVLDARAEQPRRDPACKGGDPPWLRDAGIKEVRVKAQNAAVSGEALALAVDRKQEGVWIQLHIEGIRGVVPGVDIVADRIEEDHVEEQVQQFDKGIAIRTSAEEVVLDLNDIAVRQLDIHKPRNRDRDPVDDARIQASVPVLLHCVEELGTLDCVRKLTATVTIKGVLENWRIQSGVLKWVVGDDLVHATVRV